MSSVPPALPSSTPTTIARALSLPPRVRKILGVLFDRVSLDLNERIGQMLAESEQQLFKLAERARNNEKQAEQLANLHGLRKSRADLLPMFLAGLEGEFAAIRLPRAAPAKDAHERIEYQTMTLVEDAEMDQDIVLREIARRQVARTGAPLYLMGQRFGVLAGSPALEPAQLPVGPQTLCKVLRASVAAAFKIDLNSQLLLYKTFDQKVLADYVQWMEILNALLAGQGVLPGLVYAPQPTRSDEGNRRPGHSGPRSAESASRPMTDWYGHASPSAWSAFGHDALAAATGAAPISGRAEAAQAVAGTGNSSAEQAGGDASSFATLQQLLQGRRLAMSPGRSAEPASTGSAGQAGARPPGAVTASSAADTRAAGAVLATDDVLSTLRSLQAMPVAAEPGRPHRTMLDVQKTMLAQVREQHGPHAALVQQDADTFELLGLLYHEIEREVQRDAPAADLLMRLQVPMAQAALQDREFFLRPQHPARELLNSVAESGAAWLGEDETDPQLLQKLHHAVDRVVADYNGDDKVFESVNNDLQAHFRAMARKAEITERRYVEAARGKDRLEIAKQRAAETIGAALQGRVPPKFVQALLNQAWADVLTLTQLRNGQDSEEWREQVEITGRIATVTSAGTDPAGAAEAPPADPELTPRIESALMQVGYHPDEAAAIARRLSSAEDDEATSRTELTARLKARARLGEQVEAPKAKHIERTPKEQQCHDYLRTLPFGTWFEFVKNQQGDVTRKRLSWYSPVTDHVLFVNQRGQRIGEQSMDSLARLMALDQVHVVTQDKGRLIDRAWRATVGALRSFTGTPAAGQGANA